MFSRSKYGDLTGKKFGRLTVIKQVERSSGGHVQWLCRCDCGKEKINTSSNLVKGKVKSCGCYHDEVRRRKRPGAFKAWVETCRYCGKEFQSHSHKQIYCSVECSFLGRLKESENGCLEWQGNKNAFGYGVLRGPEKKIIQAHRYAWERINGKIPEGKCVCHKCDNRQCANIDHLFLGTWYDNNHDRSLKGRSGKRVFSDEDRVRYSQMFGGENNRFAKLTKEIAKQIFYDTSLSYSGLAKKYDVSKPTITAIKNKRSWKCIHEDIDSQFAPASCGV